jgi:hypothetical protein
MTNPTLQGPLQAAIAKHQDKRIAITSTHRILEALKLHGFINAPTLAETEGFDRAKTSVALSGMYKSGSVIRRPNPEGRSNTYEYAINPNYTPKALGGAAVAANRKRGTLNITTRVTRSFSFNIHGCTATFTETELRELRDKISAALKG